MLGCIGNDAGGALITLDCSFDFLISALKTLVKIIIIVVVVIIKLSDLNLIKTLFFPVCFVS